MTWIVLFGIWPLLWGMRRYSLSRRAVARVSTNSSVLPPALPDSPPSRGIPSLAQLISILVLAVYVLNLGYLFDGFGAPLGQFVFISRDFTGNELAGEPGNRFRNSWVGSIPMPFPRQYILGIDNQKKDLESFSQNSYLRGEVRHGGWWYYYLYGLSVKLPCGLLCLMFIVVLHRLIGGRVTPEAQGELVLVLPSLTILLLASSQTEFNIHLRYVFPAIGFMLVLLGQSAAYLSFDRKPLCFLVACSIASTPVATLSVYPHHLAYFNVLAGGPRNGHKHLLGSSLDWGQNLLYLRDHVTQTGRRLEVVRGLHVIPGMAEIVIDAVDVAAKRDGIIVAISPNILMDGEQLPVDGEILVPGLWVVTRPE